MKPIASVISCISVKDQAHKAAFSVQPNSIAIVMQSSYKPESEQPILLNGATFMADLIAKTPAHEDTFAASVCNKISKEYAWVNAMSALKAKTESPKFSFFKIEEGEEYFHLALCGEFEVRILGPDGNSALLSDAQTYANMRKHFAIIGKQVSGGCLPSTERFKDIVRSLDESQSVNANTEGGSNFIFPHKQIEFRPFMTRIKKDLISKVMISSFSLAGIWENYAVTPGPMELLKTPSQDELTRLIFDLRKKERIDGFLASYPRAAINPLHSCLILSNKY